MNKNYISIIKNSEQNHMSCLKSAVKKVSEKAWHTEDDLLEITLNSNMYGDTCECYSIVKNISTADIDINQLSSAFVEVENSGNLKWYHKNKYKVHFCRNCWLGEGQWRSFTLEEMGLYQVNNGHQHNCFIDFASKGSQTTNRFYPLVMIEDLELGKTHYFEMKSASAWYIEICVESNEQGEETLYVFMSGNCEKNDGWHKCLKSDESYVSQTAIYGTVDGGFEEAVMALTEYKRLTSEVAFDNKVPPVCYNDYMNCCWAEPSWQRTTALVDKAAEAGVEIFCMDSGWQASLLDDKFRCIGDWKISDSKFSPNTFEDIIKYVNLKGMKFGAWLEIEGVQKGTKGYEEYDEYILKRRGKTIGNPKSFYDFRKPFIQDKIEKVFDTLYTKGVRYIKNDYNQTVGIGCDGADSLSEGLIENARAFCTLIGKIQKKYPDLIIENCGSGAMRCDTETLSHFHLQSVSDQEVYTCNPSITTGTMACMPPEKMGLWSYPYPVRYDDRAKYNITAEQKAEYANGYQTVFNMVNSMLGVIYLSGRIDECDQHNFELIKEAVNVYKSIRNSISSAYPIFPMGTFNINDCGIFCGGLLDKANSKIYAAVWNINSDETRGEIDFSKYGTVKDVKVLYPNMCGCNISLVCGVTEIRLPAKSTAMLVEVVLDKPEVK